jgi:hypothetical protein
MVELDYLLTHLKVSADAEKKLAPLLSMAASLQASFMRKNLISADFFEATIIIAYAKSTQQTNFESFKSLRKVEDCANLWHSSNFKCKNWIFRVKSEAIDALPVFKDVIMKNYPYSDSITTFHSYQICSQHVAAQ